MHIHEMHQIEEAFLKKYFQDKIQIVIPKTRIHFVKNGLQTKASWFDTLWVCYKMNLEKDIIFLSCFPAQTN